MTTAKRPTGIRPTVEVKTVGVILLELMFALVCRAHFGFKVCDMVDD